MDPKRVWDPSDGSHRVTRESFTNTKIENNFVLMDLYCLVNNKRTVHEDT